MSAFLPHRVTKQSGWPARAIQSVRDLSIGSKLSIGFGSLVTLFSLLVLVSSLVSAGAQSYFERTRTTRLPGALASTIAELEMYEMIGNIQGYLALGDPGYRQEFEHDVQELEALLSTMDTLSPNWTNPENLRRLAMLHAKIEQWLPLVEQMFELRDDPMSNQPALQLMVNEVRPVENAILGNIASLLELQSQRELSTESVRLLKIVADYQSSFSRLTNAIDGYLADMDPSSKAVFEKAARENDDAWNSLSSEAGLLTSEQQGVLVELKQARDLFAPLPERMFAAVESEHAREDYFILSNMAAPLATEMTSLLEEMRLDQMSSLTQDLEAGNQRLAAAQRAITIGALISVIVATGLAFAIRRDITGPVTKLTGITSQIMEGDLDARAKVESRDEIGALAASFNDMTEILRDTLAAAEQRAQIIATSSWISWRLSTILDEKQLLTEVVEQLHAAFNYYHVQVLLMDDMGANLVTAGGTGEAGHLLAESGYKIPVTKGVAGGAARLNRPILVADVSKSSEYLPNPLLPDTKTELAVPIATGDQVLGVLNVQHNVVGSLTQTDADMLRSIASQVAIALINARSYADTQRRADRERLINEINRKILDTTSIEQAMQVAVRELGKALAAQQAHIYLNTKWAKNGHS